MLSMLLYPYAGKIYISFPFLMYANQLMNAIVKVYIIFRLPKQKWANSGYEASGMAHTGKKRAMAAYITTLYVVLLIFLVMLALCRANRTIFLVDSMFFMVKFLSNRGQLPPQFKQQRLSV